MLKFYRSPQIRLLSPAFLILNILYVLIYQTRNVILMIFCPRCTSSTPSTGSIYPPSDLSNLANRSQQSNLANAKTDGIDIDLHFTGHEYSLLILLFYVPFGLCDLPLNLLTKRLSGKIVLPACEFPLLLFLI